MINLEELMKMTQGVQPSKNLGLSAGTGQTELTAAKMLQQGGGLLGSFQAGALTNKALSKSEMLDDLSNKLSSLEEYRNQKTLAMNEYKQKMEEYQKNITSIAPQLSTDLASAVKAYRTGTPLSPSAMQELSNNVTTMLSNATNGNVKSVTFANNNPSVMNITMDTGDGELKNTTKTFGEVIADLRTMKLDELADRLMFEALGENGKLLEVQQAMGAAQAAGLDPSIAGTAALGGRVQGTPQDFLAGTTNEGRSKAAQVVTAQEFLPVLKDFFFDDNGKFKKSVALAASADRATGGLLPALDDSTEEAKMAVTTAFQMMDAMLRQVSGAAVPEQEVQRWLTAYMPTTFDSDKTANYKMQVLESSINSVVNAARGLDPRMTEEQKNNILVGIMRGQQVKDMLELRKQEKGDSSSTPNRVLKFNPATGKVE